VIRRILQALASVTVALGVAILGWDSSFRGQDPQPAMQTTPAVPPGLQLQGVGSCAAAACHNGNQPAGTPGSEYSTWVGRDPHARAYTILFDERSLIIEKNLKGLKDLTSARPHENETCLDCHAHPAVGKSLRHPRFDLRDGVGCESCHGPAQKWLSRHYTDEWKVLSATEKQAQGMNDTKDLVVRARLCTACHVGRGDGDVNHDLIAAGHPQMRFEYGAYLANYTKHWRQSDDKRRYRDFEARTWLIGQLATAQAAVELLADRASRGDKPWPEFAEYGCFGCHHDLQDKRWRQVGGERGRAAGSLPWGAWYMPVLPSLARREGIDLASLSGLEKLMEKTFPARTEVPAQARRASAALDKWLKKVAKTPLDEKSLQGLLTALAKDDKLATASWESATQMYLGIAAIYQALREGESGGRYDRPGVRDSIRSMADLLDRAFQSPEARYESPRDFRPEAMQSKLNNLRRQLQLRGLE
jgi:hypothetical protein